MVGGVGAVEVGACVGEAQLWAFEFRISTSAESSPMFTTETTTLIGGSSGFPVSVRDWPASSLSTCLVNWFDVASVW
jgi:hypothetical protein